MVVFPRQLVCQRTLYFIQLRGFLVPTLLPGLIVIRSQLGPCLEASNLAHLPMPVARTSSEASACSSGVKALLRALHVVQPVPSQFAFTPKVTTPEPSGPPAK